MRLPSGEISKSSPGRSTRGAVEGGIITNLLSGRDTGCGELQKAIPKAMRPISNATLQGIALLQSAGWAGLVTPIGAAAGSVRASFISTRTLAMSRRRSWASLVRHQRSSSLILQGVCSGNFSQSGSLLRTVAMVSAIVSPSKAFLAVNSS